MWPGRARSAGFASVATAETLAFRYLTRVIELPMARVLAPLGGTAAATLLMAAVVVGVQAVLASAPEAVRLALAVVAGVASYGAAHMLVNRERFLASMAGLRGVAGAKGRVA